MRNKIIKAIEEKNRKLSTVEIMSYIKKKS